MNTVHYKKKIEIFLFIKLNKNQIKSNQIRQNFQKIISKNEIFENKFLLKTIF